MDSSVRYAVLTALFAALCLPAPAGAQTPPPPPDPANRRPGGGQVPPQPSNRPRPYAEVITKDAKSDEGLFKTHQIDERFYFEIPKEALGKELLWVTTRERSTSFYGFARTEVQDRVIRFEKRGDRILLREVSYAQRAADPRGDAQRTLAKGNIEPILAAYPVLAYGPGESAVIDASPVIFGELSGLRFDPTRSFIDRIRAFPKNVQVKVTGTTAAPASPAPPGPFAPAAAGTATVAVHHSLVLLPEKPMMPRLFDSRVGWFSTAFNELGSPENRVKEVAYINRWRLEKKDPTAMLSEPVTPITYYLGAEIPAPWKPYVKKGVEAWNAAFEKAGFKNAVICREIPTKEEDPEFDPEDVRYTVIHWLPSETENAYGPSLADPRTGEILNGSPKIFHNILKLVQTWYFTQASPSDPRARKLPLPEDLTGELVAYVVTHEVGHTLGFPHNMKASSSFSIRQLRDPAWTAKWGVEASIMDYGRFNYIAQPGDGAQQIGKIGPYDHFAVEWGYAPIPGAKTPEEEKPALNALAARQIADPMLRFGDANPLEDPARQTEDLSDDPIEAGRLGMANLKRVMGYLLPAATKPGEDYALLAETYSNVLMQRRLELQHVVALIGGVNEDEFHAGQGRPVNYTPVPRARQKEAVRFLAENVLVPQTWLIRPDVVGKIEAGGGADRLLAEQSGVLSLALVETRLRRMAEQEATQGAKAYTVGELLGDLRAGVFTEAASAGPVKAGLYRRNLQKRYLEILAAKLNPPVAAAPPATGRGPGGAVAAPATVSGETRAEVRGSLEDIRTTLRAAVARAADRPTRLHLLECLEIIRDALEPPR